MARFCRVSFLKSTLLVRKKAIIFLLILCACQNSTYVKPTQIHSSITNKEKKILEKFFRILIFEEDFGYVLLGAKPVSTSFYLKIIPKTNNWFDVLASFTKTNRIMRNGWEIWKKYYSCPWFWDEPSSQSPNHFHLILANPKRVREVVEQYQEDFKIILGKKGLILQRISQTLVGISFVNSLPIKQKKLVGS